MKNHLIHRLILSLFFLALAAGLHADIIVLKTGAKIRGTVVFENEEVFIFRDAEGARYQYPRSEVAGVLPDEEPEQQQQQQQEESIRSSKKVSILLELGGGPAFVPGKQIGGAFSVDFLVGSHHLANRHLFVGAGLGYHGMFIGAEKYNFLPIQAAVRMPLTEEKHAPVFGASLGYGIALSKDYLGGVYAGLDFGYRCQLNPKTAIALVAFGQFQQALVPAEEVVDGNTFVNRTGRNLVTAGLKLALYF